MNPSFSTLVVVWLLGTWYANFPPEITSQATELTPITIFASYFSLVGLAGFGILSSWAMFLGIFRLRQNGNFFGSRDGNEAFFYPLRIVFALCMCAPVIPAGATSGTQVILTPGHQLIASITITGSEWGDDAAVTSNRLMGDYIHSANPDYSNPVKEREAKNLIRNWLDLASSASGYHTNKNPHDILRDMSSTEIAELLIEGQWRRQYTSPSDAGYFGPKSATHPHISMILDYTRVPLIPPTDEIAARISYSSSEMDHETAGETSTDYELNSENILCQFAGSDSFVCPESINQLRAVNDKAISVGLAAAQRDLWKRLYTTAYNTHSTIFTNNTEQAAKLSEDTESYLNAETKWYSAVATRLIKNYLVETQKKATEDYYSSMESWGWMTIGTFAMRVSNDFSRAQSYGSGATSKLYPTTALSSLTSADDITKLGQTTLERTSDGKIQGIDLYEALGLPILKTDPSRANLHTITAFGRELAGTGIMFISGSGLAKLFGKDGKTTTILAVIGGLLLLAGAFLGYILPVVFAIFGLMGVISWLTFVASAFFGVTLWGAAFAAPKGDEHTSQMAAKGWNTLIFLGFYPALAVGGLAAAVTITSIALPLVNVTLGGVWGAMTGSADLTQPFDALAGYLIGAVVMVLVNSMLFWSACITSAQLITNFPRTVLNMVSFSEPGLNPYENTAPGIMGNVSSMVRAPLSMATTALTRRLVGGNPRAPEGGGQ